MTRTKPNGWQLLSINRPKELVRPAVPTIWEGWLREYGLDESQIADFLCSRCKKAVEFRGLIKKHKDKVYIPPSILAALQIRSRWE